LLSGESLPDRAYYEKVAANAGGSIRLSLMGLGLTWIASLAWMPLAKGFFWLGLVLNGLNTLNVIFVTGLGIVGIFGGTRESRWIWAANGARLVEVGLCALVMWLSAHLVGYLS